MKGIIYTIMMFGVALNVYASENVKDSINQPQNEAGGSAFDTKESSGKKNGYANLRGYNKTYCGNRRSY
ncbi:MAG: hypothetical protein K6C34_00345 [Alphaproteobacteria bacterium]|nr:hypothetical protein [Alphaproteobacteria bacterium]